MIRNFVQYVALVTCDSATDDCEALVRDVGDTRGEAAIFARREAERQGWVAVWQLGGQLLIHRCPAHAAEVAHLEPVSAF